MADKLPEPVAAYRIYAYTVGEEFWLVESDDDAAKLESELAREGDWRPVFTRTELVHQESPPGFAGEAVKRACFVRAHQCPIRNPYLNTALEAAIPEGP